jgi:hypothetical protein
MGCKQHYIHSESIVYVVPLIAITSEDTAYAILDRPDHTEGVYAYGYHACILSRCHDCELVNPCLEVYQKPDHV